MTTESESQLEKSVYLFGGGGGAVEARSALEADAAL